jgi:hypothetical protein
MKNLCSQQNLLAGLLTNLLTASGVIVVAIAITSCAPGSRPLNMGWSEYLNQMQPPQVESQESETEGDILTSADGQEQITLSPGWQAAELNEGAQLEAANPDLELYIVIFSELRSDLPPDTSLERFSEVTRTIVIDNLTDTRVDGPTGVTEIGGESAIQYEISGQISGETEQINVTYLHTAVETGDRFHQILAWSDSSTFADARTNLQQITQSFRGVSEQ